MKKIIRKINWLLIGCFFVYLICSTQGYTSHIRKFFITDETTGKTAAVETNGGLAVNIQDQHSLALDLRFIQAQGPPTTLSVQANPDDKTITVVSTTNFVAGNTVGIFSDTGFFYFGKQIGAPAGNVISLDTPVDRMFIIGSNVLTAIDNLNVDGSITTQIFQIGPIGQDIEVDITRIMGYIEDSVSMDDSRFGGLAPLTNGIVFRHNNTVINNLWNIKSNGDFGLLCFDFSYTDKAPAGNYGMRFRNTYAGPSKHGVTIRLMPSDILQLLIQDDLTGLVKFNMMAQGHLVTD